MNLSKAKPGDVIYDIKNGKIVLFKGFHAHKWYPEQITAWYSYLYKNLIGKMIECSTEVTKEEIKEIISNRINITTLYETGKLSDTVVEMLKSPDEVIREIGFLQLQRIINKYNF